MLSKIRVLSCIYVPAHVLLAGPSVKQINTQTTFNEEF